MDRILGPIISCFDAPFFRIDVLTKLIEVTQNLSLIASVRQLVPDAEFDQFSYRCRLEINANTKGSHFPNGFIDPYVNACLVQAQGHRRSCDSTPDNDYIHSSIFLHPLSMAPIAPKRPGHLTRRPKREATIDSY